MVKSSTLLKILGITDTNDHIHMYNRTVGLWETEQIDHVFSVRSQQAIFLKLPTVVDCPRLETLLDSSLTLNSSPSRKRKVLDAFSKSELESSSDPYRRKLTHDLDDVMTPVDGSSSDSNPFVSLASFPASNLSDRSLHDLSTPSLAHSLAKPTNENLNPIRISLNRSWPQGMYAQDVARGLSSIKSADASMLADRFAEIFGSAVPYKKSTFLRHQRFWKQSTTKERELALSLPRDDKGLWDPWYKSMSGYLKSKY